MPHVETILTALEKAMAVGNFRGARKALEKFQQAVGGEAALHDWMGQRSLEDPLRARLAAAMAEVYFYQGTNKQAWALLKDYASQPQILYGMEDVPARARLQVGEYFYAQREFERAKAIGETILAQCREKKDVRGMGESAYYLARFCRLLHRFDEVEEYCALALQSFAQEGMTYNEEPLGVRWRIGLVLLVAGYAKSQVGELVKGMSKLYIAQWLLKKTGDTVSQANAEHSLGNILRAQGQPEEALRVFARARKHYEDAKHPLNLSRVLLSTGRTYIQIAAWGNAQKCFEEALKIVEEIKATRQKAEILVYMSWLYQEGDPQDLSRAERCIQQAQRLDDIDPWTRIEAMIARGNCRLQQGEYDKAKDNLDIALMKANELGLAKLKVHARLSLAELHCRPSVRNMTTATAHYEEAQKLATPTFSFYLARKAERIRQTIASSQSTLFVVSIDHIKGERGLKELTRAFQAWAAEKAMELTENKSQAARLLGLTRQGFDKLRDRLVYEDPAS